MRSKREFLCVRCGAYGGERPTSCRCNGRIWIKLETAAREMVAYRQLSAALETLLRHTGEELAVLIHRDSLGLAYVAMVDSEGTATHDSCGQSAADALISLAKQLRAPEGRG